MPPDGEVSPTAIYACVPALGSMPAPNSVPPDSVNVPSPINRRVHHGIRAADFDLAARDRPVSLLESRPSSHQSMYRSP